MALLLIGEKKFTSVHIWQITIALHKLLSQIVNTKLSNIIPSL